VCVRFACDEDVKSEVCVRRVAAKNQT
jgi:hypothetical protein